MPPLNRVVAFAGPYISLAAGSLATYLFAKLNVLGVPGLTEGGLTTDLTAALTFVVTTLVTWLGQASWLKGHHIQLQRGVIEGRKLKLKGSPVIGTAGDSASAANTGDMVASKLGTSTTLGYVDRDTSNWAPGEVGLIDVDHDPDMGEPVDAVPESYLGDPRDKHGAKDRPA